MCLSCPWDGLKKRSIFIVVQSFFKLIVIVCFVLFEVLHLKNCGSFLFPYFDLSLKMLCDINRLKVLKQSPGDYAVRL